MPLRLFDMGMFCMCGSDLPQGYTPKEQTMTTRTPSTPKKPVTKAPRRRAGNAAATARKKVETVATDVADVASSVATEVKEAAQDVVASVQQDAAKADVKPAADTAKDAAAAVSDVVVQRQQQAAEVVAVSKQAVENVVKASAEAMSKNVEKVMDLSKERMDGMYRNGDQAFKTYEEVVSYGKENVDALVKSGSAAVKGWQDLMKTSVSLCYATLEEGVNTGKAMIASKSLNDIWAAQQDGAIQMMDKFMEESSRMNDMALHMLEEAAAPLRGRVEHTIEKMVAMGK
jgi:phasin family protein